MNRFVVGFAFTEKMDRILLMTKLRPKWQEGLLNGIGGHIKESDELSHDAMHRECAEETGLSLDWIRRGIMQGINDDTCYFTCYIFYAYSQSILDYKQIEDEPLRLYNPLQIKPTKMVANLNFLIPFGIYHRNRSSFMSLTYPGELS